MKIKRSKQNKKYSRELPPRRNNETENDRKINWVNNRNIEKLPRNNEMRNDGKYHTNQITQKIRNSEKSPRNIMKWEMMEKK